MEVLVDEVGSPVAKAGFEVATAIGTLRAAAGITRRVNGQTLQSDTPERFSMTIRSPLGVVAAITPFNVPLIKGTRLTANAMALGNCVVLLPSEMAPVLSNLLAKLYADAGFPPGVFNVVNGLGEEIGDHLTSHPMVRYVCFTGSSRVGAHIQAQCGQQGKGCTLELGGKSPLVVMADADIAKAVEAAVMGVFLYQGQICMAASRIYVERPVLEAFKAAYKGAAESMSVGTIREPGTFVGPIISERQRQRIRSHVEDAQAKGATVVTGGNWEGNCIRPTILTGVTEEMTVYGEETFGPVTSIYPVDSLDEAIELANDSDYGLSSAIYTSNINSAMRFVTEIESGMVHVNAPTLTDEPHVPMGGVKSSGFGREGTEDDILALTELKWATIQM